MNPSDAKAGGSQCQGAKGEVAAIYVAESALLVYKANLHLLNEVQISGVDKRIYVSVLNGHRLRHLKIFDKKEKFLNS
jgi:hypothetical protein